MQAQRPLVAALLLAAAHCVAAASPAADITCTIVSSLGCFVDQEDNRILAHGIKAPPFPATHASCAALVAATVGVAAMPSTLLGVQAGKQCWWGPANASAGPPGVRVNASDCGLPCVGNASEMCGGEWREEVYTAACTAPPLAPTPMPLPVEQSVAFAPHDCDQCGECYPCFRIPALNRAASGALLAFAEARGGRMGSCADHGDVKVVMRASLDGSGRNGTWGPIVVVANETGHTIGNPSPVVDASSGRVFCHFARDNVDAFVAWSDDHGATWSERMALDAAVKVPGSGWYGSGVGGGVQFGAQIGAPARLMILSEERVGPAFNSVPVYSDDGGVSWARLPYLNCSLPGCNNRTHGLGEPSVDARPEMGGASASAAQLIVSGRGAAAPYVSYALSEDGGATWSGARTISAITSPGCQAPVVFSHDGSYALITSPVGPGRHTLGVFRATAAAGFDDWALAPAGAAARGILREGGAAYSSLLRAERPDEFLVLVETGDMAEVSLLRFDVMRNYYKT